MRAAVYCGTRNIYQDMIPSMKSLLKYSNVEKIYFLIEDDQFSYELPPEVECINVSNQTWFDPEGPNFVSNWSYMILLRAALTKLFPKLDKILSLDCDTLVQNNISELWDLPLDDYYFAAVKEPEKSTAEFSYINAGVMMFNLKKIREDHLDDKYIYDLNNCFRYYPEQECFSALSQGKILELPSKYNLSCVSGTSVDEKIIHFAAYKKWTTLKIIQEYRNLPLDFARNQYNKINLNDTYKLFTFTNITIQQDDINQIIDTIKNNSAGYMYIWENKYIILKQDFIKRYNLDENLSTNGLLWISRTLLSFLHSIDYCKRIFIFDNKNASLNEDFYSQLEISPKEVYYLINKSRELKIPMKYVIHELNHLIVWFYWIFLQIIQKEPFQASNSWTIIKEIYDKYYSKYELTASIELPGVYYKVNTQLIQMMKTWHHPIRININKFLQELKTQKNMPGRYKFD